MYELHTARTHLTLLTGSDLHAMEALAREPDTFKYIKKLQVMSPEQYTQFLHVKLEQIRTGAGYHWAVWLRTDNSFVGAVNLNPIRNTIAVSAPGNAPTPDHAPASSPGNASTPGPARMQIGCQLKREYWDQGFASELTRRLLDFAIYELKLPAVYGVFEKDNEASRRLLKKLGFVFEESAQEQEMIVETHKFISPLSDPHQAHPPRPHPHLPS
jgi:RimJ/RimL family protein N-acetyltransferase